MTTSQQWSSQSPHKYPGDMALSDMRDSSWLGRCSPHLAGIANRALLSITQLTAILLVVVLLLPATALQAQAQITLRMSTQTAQPFLYGDDAEIDFFFTNGIPAGFDLSDVQVTNGSLSNLQTITTTHYRAFFAPQAGFDGTTTLTVAAGSYTDQSGTPAGEAASQTFQIAADVPTYEVRRISASPTTASSISFSVKFSENVRKVNAEDFDRVVTGSANIGEPITSTRISSDEYIVTFNEVTGTGTIGLILSNLNNIDDVDGNVATNSVLASNEIVNELYTVTDATGPEITLSSSESGEVANNGTDTHSGAIAGNSKTVTYTVLNSGNAELAVSAITASSLNNISGSVTISPSVLSVNQNDGVNDGQATFDVTYRPSATGNYSFNLEITNNDSDEASYIIAVTGTADPDTIAPTVESITASDSSVTVPNSTVSIVVKFSEAMDASQTPTLSFTPDVSSALENAATQTGTWSSDTNPNDTYTVTYTVQNVTTVINGIDVTASTAFQDAQDNPLASDHTVADVFSINIVQDITAPEVSDVQVSADTITSGVTGFSITIKFNEIMDNSLTNHAQHLSFTPDVASVLTSVTSESWSDSSTYVVTYAVTDVGTNIDDVDLEIPATALFQDRAGIGLTPYTAEDLFSVEQDTTAPTVTSVVPSATTLGSGISTFSIEVTFSEAMNTSLTPTLSFSDDISTVLPNATSASGSWTDSRTYEITYTTINDVGANISGIDVVISTDFEDVGGNPLENEYTATDVFDILQDTTPPSVTISAPAEARGPFTATFTFSENVTGFDNVSDITVGNGTVSNLSAGTIVNGEEIFTATITPVEHGPVTIDVGAGVAEDDPAGNPNTAADQVTVNYIDENYVRQRTSRIISNFMTRRGDAITSNQPDYTERLNQSGQGSSGAGASFSGEGSYSNNRMNFATSLRQMLSANKAKKNAQVSELGEMMKLGLQSKGTQSLGLRSNLATNAGAAAGFDLWVKGRWARYENDTNEGDLGLLFIGADYKFNDGLVIGLVAQFDWTDEVDDSEDFKINGRGWMVGPYLVAQLHQNLIFDANFSWGQSDNEVSPFNTYTDKFDGTRWLASAKFTGSFKFGNLHIAPHIGVMYYQERQDAYVDSLSIDIPSQTVKLGRLTFGPKISTTIQRKDGMTISPYVGVKGLWDFERTDIVDLTTGLAAESTDDLRARVDAGVSVRLPDGLTLNGEGFYDGIGADDYKSYGGSIRLNIPLQRDSSAADAMKLGIGLEKAAGIGQSSPKPAATKGENTIQR